MLVLSDKASEDEYIKFLCQQANLKMQSDALSSLHTFRAGDLVYYPSKTNAICKLVQDVPGFLTTEIAGGFFTSQGLDDSSCRPVIFKASLSNCNALASLYRTRFELPE